MTILRLQNHLTFVSPGVNIGLSLRQYSGRYANTDWVIAWCDWIYLQYSCLYPDGDYRTVKAGIREERLRYPQYSWKWPSLKSHTFAVKNVWYGRAHLMKTRLLKRRLMKTGDALVLSVWDGATFRLLIAWVYLIWAAGSWL